MHKIILKRICMGYYTMTRMIDGVAERQAFIDYMPHLKGWVVSADWDMYLYTDVIDSYREAKEAARSMINRD